MKKSTLGLWTIICILAWSRSRDQKWGYAAALSFVCSMIGFMSLLLQYVNTSS